MVSPSFSLPIDAVSGDVANALEMGTSAVLVAPPGAGKTTRLPLVLLETSFATGSKIIMLEPRRLAARAAAERMAATLGERVGETVGLRVRLDARVSAKTRLEIVTEGVFARMIIDDPALSGVGAVLFDEFHERSLDADLGLALALDARSGLREDLRLLVMSATLDGARVARMLGKAPVVESAGRSFPVETRYVGRNPRDRIETAVTRVALAALGDEQGSILIFLPGQSEIVRVAAELADRIADPNVDIAPLFGAMRPDAQSRAIAPSPEGRRKIVLATSIAETSLTIEGVRVVIDSGLARVPRYEPDIGLTRLETVRVSRAAADQRRGRAGRTAPGVCYRLWEEAATGALEPFTKPEILAADLSGLLLDLAAWGIREPAMLDWLDPPPAPAIAEARELLATLGALDERGALTDEGKAIRSLPLPARLGRMVIDAARRDAEGVAAELAVILVERGLGGNAVDLIERVEMLRRDASPRGKEARRLAGRWAGQIRNKRSRPTGGNDLSCAGRLIASAYPERIGKARGKFGEFRMVNGRAGMLDPQEHLARAEFLAVAEIAGRAAAARILAAVPITREEIESEFADQIETRTSVTFDNATAALRARRLKRLGSLILDEQTLPIPMTDAAAVVLAEGIAALGIDRLPWNKALLQWRDRVMFLRRAEGEPWPDLADSTLAASAKDWLAPHLEGRTSLAAIDAEDFAQALQALLPWDVARRLDLEAPTHFEAPSGTRVAIDYAAEGAPVVAIRVQELYGLNDHPVLARNRAPLTLHLLSPAQRPIQITRDLPGFWRGSWTDVKAEMKGRYPRHSWPDDPASAVPTNRAKPRGT
jgi:ATP-dependent helicase HrpB